MSIKQVKCVGALANAILIGGLAAQAQQVNLSYGSHSATLDLTGPGAGMTAWNAGGMDRLNLQWFYYRIGSSGLNAPIDSLGLVTQTLTGGNKLDVVYGQAGSPVEVRVSYTLGASGGAPDIMEDIWIKNISGAPITGFTFFQYSDFDLSPNDTVVISSAIGAPNTYSVATQFGGVAELSESIVSPEAAGAEAANAAALLTRITTVNGANLDGTLTYSGDAAWAFQWTFANLGDGQDVNIIKDKILWVTAVPEPTSASLILMGLAGLILRHHQR